MTDQLQPERELATRRPLVAVVGPGQAFDPVVRWAGTLAADMRCPWIAVFIEGPRPLAGEAQMRLARNLSLARELGAEIITTSDKDVVEGLLRIVRQRDAAGIVVGKPPVDLGWPRAVNDRMLRRLIRESGETRLHIVPVPDPAPSHSGRGPAWQWPSWWQYFASMSVVALVTLVVFPFTPLLGAHTAALILLLTVVALALFVDRGPALAAAAMSAMMWDFFCLAPLYNFRIARLEDVMMFATYFVVASVLGQLTARIRAQENTERGREERATALYLLTRELHDAVATDQLVRTVIQQIGRTFKARVAVLLPDAQNALQPHPAGTFAVPKEDQAIVAWAREHGRPAGKSTPEFSTAEALYLPLATVGGPIGVVAVRPGWLFPASVHQRNLLDAFLDQIALAFERHRLNEISERAKLLAESERLSKTLLDSMSHEIRTPIAAIKSAAGTLAELRDGGPPNLESRMIEEIQEATGRLNRVVGNVLEASRLESGMVKARINDCDVAEVVHLAVAETERDLARHAVSVTLAPELPLARMDFVLTQQALMNLLSNAARHTPTGTAVEVAARVEGNDIVVTVADRGPGIDPALVDRIFDRFYRAPKAPTGGTGLGLSLVRGFIEAQGGSVRADLRQGGGMVFAIRLPVAKNAGVGMNNAHE